MSNNQSLNYIKECLSLAEEKFQRGRSDEWTNYDFEKLSEEIQEVTGVLLSITTLKRVFGKVKYDNAPSTVTLNTLAQYAGFTDWGSFKLQTASKSKTAGVLKGKRFLSNASAYRRVCWWAGGAVAAFLLFALFSGLTKRPSMSTSDISAYAFSSKKVLTSGVPNSVIFNYDASQAGNDSVFITQSWDVSRKKLVSRNNHTYSSIYYYPGFFRAQLIQGNKVLKHHDILITTKGWLAAVPQQTIPLYFKKEEFLKDSMVVIAPSLLETYHLTLQPHPPTICLFNVRALSGLQNDNFTFETTLKNDFKAGSAACQKIGVQILCKNDVISIPLCAKGCVGDLQLFAAGRKVTSAESDLSGFGCDLTKWTTLRIEATNKLLRFIVNGKKACSLVFPNSPADIVGVKYTFVGTAAIKTARFQNKNKAYTLL